MTFLYLGVGDPRNPLASLVQVPEHRPVSFHLNDFSPVVLSRAIVLIALAAAGAGGEDDAGAAAMAAATATWSDARLSRKSAAALHVRSTSPCLAILLIYLTIG